MSLRVEGVSVARGGRTLVKDVSFHLPSGTALTIHGPNGVGKTSLLRVIAGLAKAMDGQIEIDLDDTIYLGAQHGVKQNLTVRENLEFWATLFGHKQNIAAAMTEFGLEPLANRRAGLLSTGQRRRVGLARLIAVARQLWILDEPTLSLDTAHTARFSAMVQRHLDQGGSAVIVSHVDIGLGSPVYDLAACRVELS